MGRAIPAILVSTVAGAVLVQAILAPRISPQYAASTPASSSAGVAEAALYCRRRDRVTARLARFRERPAFMRAYQLAEAECRLLEAERKSLLEGGFVPSGASIEEDREALRSTTTMLRRLARNRAQQQYASFMELCTAAACDPRPDTYR